MTVLAFSNMGRGVAPFKARQNFEKVHKALPDAIQSWCEIDEADQANEHKMLKALYGDTHRIVSFTSKVPVCVPKDDWRVVWTKQVLGAKGRPKVSPDRFIVVTRLDRKQRPGIKFIHINVHFPLAKAKDLWEEVLQKLKRIVERHEKAGYAIIITGDFNVLHAPLIHGRQRVIAHDRRDYIILIQGREVIVRKKADWKINTNIDGHNCIAARVSFAFRKRPSNG